MLPKSMKEVWKILSSGKDLVSNSSAGSLVSARVQPWPACGFSPAPATASAGGGTALRAVAAARPVSLFPQCVLFAILRWLDRWA